jgi:hypothetical protein
MGWENTVGTAPPLATSEIVAEEEFEQPVGVKERGEIRLEGVLGTFLKSCAVETAFSIMGAA